MQKALSTNLRHQMSPVFDAVETQGLVGDVCSIGGT
jgi:hypothetical protein